MQEFYKYQICYLCPLMAVTYSSKIMLPAQPISLYEIFKLRWLCDPPLRLVYFRHPFFDSIFVPLFCATSFGSLSNAFYLSKTLSISFYLN